MSAYSWVIVSLCATGLLGCMSFVVRYSVVSRRTNLGPWWRHEVGWWLAAVPLNLASLFLLVMLNNLDAEWPGRRAVTVLLFTAYVIETWWPVRLLSKLNRPQRTGEEVSRDGRRTHA